MSKKERLEGVQLQFGSIFDRLDALRDALPEASKKKYQALIDKQKKHLKEKYDVNEQQLDEWLQ